VNTSATPVASSDLDFKRAGSVLLSLVLDLTNGPKRRTALALGAVLFTGTGLTAYSLDHARHANQLASAELTAKAAEVAQMKVEVARMRTGMAALTATVQATTQRIEARQVAIAAALQGQRAHIQLAAASAAADPRLAALAPGAMQILAPLARLETHQLALVVTATSAAHARLLGATGTIRQLGLDPHRFTRASSFGMGGPFDPITPDAPTPRQRALQDEAFQEQAPQSQAKVQDLSQAWNKLSQLGQATASIPSRMPVSNFSYTSGFGGRYDPFNGGAAFHPGVDMAGPTGEPIAAAATGTVVRAGWFGGYGNCIEIDHGHGLATRYGHLSRIMVRIGDHIGAGDQIGRMGSTGRSTGSHLHFEVRVDGHAVDPMPYLRAMPQIAAMQAAANAPVVDIGVGGPAQP